MKIGLAEVDWAYVGAALAKEDDEAQATFFKAMLKEMDAYGTAHQKEMQLLAIGRKLTEDERRTISTICC